MPPRIFAVLLALSLLIFPCPGGSAQARQAKPETVRLQLKWRHQFQFAGYYMAKAKGYYADEGLEGDIVEANPNTLFTEEVVSGRAHYGINNSDLLIDRSKGKKVVVLGVIFQHSPLILLSLASRGIKSPDDLIGKRIMLSQEAEAEILSTLANESIPREKLVLQDHSL